MPCFTAMRAEIALMSGSAFCRYAPRLSSGAGRTSDGNGSHASTLKSPSYTKSVSWQHLPSYRTSLTNALSVISPSLVHRYIRDERFLILISFTIRYFHHFRKQTYFY
ncbi:putative transposase [Shigella flexneri 2747-71]|nr:putative transposase [Shigella flexneri 2747-71]